MILKHYSMSLAYGAVETCDVLLLAGMNPNFFYQGYCNSIWWKQIWSVVIVSTHVVAKGHKTVNQKKKKNSEGNTIFLHARLL